MTIHQATSHIANSITEIYQPQEAINIADYVIEHITALPKIERILQKHQLLHEAQQQQITFYLDQLLQHKPIQYVLNEAWFAGLKWYVDDSVLIPRPETDELVDWVVNEVNEQGHTRIFNSLQIIDIGTGSGCIAISLKIKLSSASITAIDISHAALTVASKNADTHQAIINFKQFDFLDATNQWHLLDKYDIIVSNPPYIQQLEQSNMAKHVIDFEPNTALFVPNSDPLIFYRNIALFAHTQLKEQGKIFVEINEAFGKATLEMFIHLGYQAKLKTDLQGKDRMIMAWTQNRIN